jgi:collagenase-like PrtC family protease
MVLYSREDRPFLTLNGIQTQSALTYNLLGELPDMVCLEVDVVRVSPQAQRTERIVAAFREVLDERRPAAEVAAALDAQLSLGACSGYWYGRPGIAVGPVMDRTAGRLSRPDTKWCSLAC